MPVGAMSLRIGRSLLSGPSIAVYLPGGCSASSNPLFRISPASVCGLSSQSGRGTIGGPFGLPALLESSVRSSSARRTHASLARSAGQKTTWDDAADSYFSEDGAKETPAPNSAGVRKWKSPANRERQEFRSNPDADEGDANGSPSRSRKSEFSNRERRDVERRSSSGTGRNQTDKWPGPSVERTSSYRTERNQTDKWPGPSVERRSSYGTGRNQTDNRHGSAVERRSSYGSERNQTDKWEGSAGRGYRSRDGGAYSGGRSGNDWQTRGKRPDSSWGKDYNVGQDDRAGFGDERRWQAREYSPPLPVEGQALYGVAPIISALQISRRTFYALYMQENLLLNIGMGKRKDKAAVTAIEKMARDMGVTVKEASKHDLNMLVDNRPHQGLILDASPLELIPLDALDPPVYEENKPPVWVALDEVTDPQNFGAILRSAYFLGAEGVVVCAKNSAPLSGVVSKASAGAMEVMEVLFCKNMVKFLERCKENGWRVVGAAAEAASVSVRQLPHGIATILVLGSEGKGLRTNVKRSCEQLVSIAGVSTGNQRPKYDFVAQDFEESEFDADEDEDSGRRGPESGLITGPSAVDSLNVSVAAGIMLYELLGSPAKKDALA